MYEISLLIIRMLSVYRVMGVLRVGWKTRRSRRGTVILVKIAKAVQSGGWFVRLEALFTLGV